MTKKVTNKNTKPKPTKDDLKALQSDWNAIGQGIRTVLCGNKSLTTGKR